MASGSIRKRYLHDMPPDDNACYDALKARDHRFDGLFFVGVLSTGIYCRPVCPARTPKRANCRFFTTAAAAEKSGLRPCLRCRPELAPGNAPVDHAQRIARRLIEHLHEEPGDDTNLESIAAGLEISSRQLRRIVQQELGVSPIELIQTRRLLLAKQLLTETRLPITEIAFASGFSSLRRFNDAFATRYRMPPGHLRKEAAASPEILDSETSRLRLSYRPPFDWDHVLDFLHLRSIRGVESVSGGTYSRTVRIGPHTGWIRISHAPEKNSLIVEFTHTLLPVLQTLLSKIRHLFDLDAQPDAIAATLSKDPQLAPLVAARPGLRLPGAFDGFEMAVRAILGQQITVKAATTIGGRFAAAFGEIISTPDPALTRLAPTSETVSRASIDDIASLGIIRTRTNSILALAKAANAGTLDLHPGANPADAISKLKALPGIGEWTANYIAMRALRWPDAFPKGDIVINKRLGNLTSDAAAKRSAIWSPWRAYAVIHLWNAPG